MDPRNKQNSTQAVVPSTPPLKGSTPVAPVPFRTAELPPTRLKMTPAQDVSSSAIVPQAVAPPELPTKKAAAQSAKQQQRQEILKLAADHAIPIEYARLVHSGAWTLEWAQRRHLSNEYRAQKLAERLRIQEAEEAQAGAILKRWMDQNTDLARLTHGGPVTAHLLQVEKFQWLWDDQPESQPKLETFAVLSLDDFRRWSSQWHTDSELANQRMQVAPRYSDRTVIPRWKLEKAYREQLACQVILYNGLEIEGFISGFYEFSLEFVQSLEEDAPRLFVLRHGIYQFWIFTDPEPVVTESATIESAPDAQVVAT